MEEKKVKIKNQTGIHARPASMIVQKANNFSSDIFISKDNREANAKSIMGIMSLGISQSTKVTIKAKGEDEKKAVEEIVALIESGFGEK